MKDVIQAMDEYLNKLIHYIGDEDLNDEIFAYCYRHSNKLKGTFLVLDYLEGAFICENIETAILQIGPRYSQFETFNSDPMFFKDTIKESLLNSILKIIKSYQNEDKNELFQALVMLKTSATKFEEECDMMIFEPPDEDLEDEIE